MISNIISNSDSDRLTTGPEGGADPSAGPSNTPRVKSKKDTRNIKVRWESGV